MEHRFVASPWHAGSEPWRLVRSAREGVRWERADGLAVRVAAPERESSIERARISLVGMLLAWAASGTAQE